MLAPGSLDRPRRRCQRRAGPDDPRSRPGAHPGARRGGGCAARAALIEYGPHADEVFAAAALSPTAPSPSWTPAASPTSASAACAPSMPMAWSKSISSPARSPTPRRARWRALEMGDPLGESVAGFVAAARGGDRRRWCAGTGGPGAGNRAPDRGSGRRRRALPLARARYGRVGRHGLSGFSFSRLKCSKQRP